MAEERLWSAEYETSRARRGAAAPTRVVGIRCPFCDVVIEAYVWSLAGSGKRCVCGVKHTWLGQISTRSPDGGTS